MRAHLSLCCADVGTTYPITQSHTHIPNHTLSLKVTQTQPDKRQHTRCTTTTTTIITCTWIQYECALLSLFVDCTHQINILALVAPIFSFSFNSPPTHTDTHHTSHTRHIYYTTHHTYAYCTSHPPHTLHRRNSTQYL